MTTKHDDRCANCGKFVEKDADGFYDREWPYHETAHTVVYCDEACCNAKRRKDRLEHRDIIGTLNAYRQGRIPYNAEHVTQLLHRLDALQRAWACELADKAPQVVEMIVRNRSTQTTKDRT